MNLYSEVANLILFERNKLQRNIVLKEMLRPTFFFLSLNILSFGLSLSPSPLLSVTSSVDFGLKTITPIVYFISNFMKLKITSWRVLRFCSLNIIMVWLEICVFVCFKRLIMQNFKLDGMNIVILYCKNMLNRLSWRTKK